MSRSDAARDDRFIFLMRVSDAARDDQSVFFTSLSNAARDDLSVFLTSLSDAARDDLPVFLKPPAHHLVTRRPSPRMELFESSHHLVTSCLPQSSFASKVEDAVSELQANAPSASTEPDKAPIPLAADGSVSPLLGDDAKVRRRIPRCYSASLRDHRSATHRSSGRMTNGTSRIRVGQIAASMRLA